MGVVSVTQTADHELTLAWSSDASNDVIADSALTLILGIDKSPASVKRTCSIFHCTLAHPFRLVTSHSHTHSHPHSEKNSVDNNHSLPYLCALLESHFGDVQWPIKNRSFLPDAIKSSTLGDNSVLIQVDDASAIVDADTLVRTYIIYRLCNSSSISPLRVQMSVSSGALKKYSTWHASP